MGRAVAEQGRHDQGQLGYTYDSFGRIATSTDPTNKKTTYTYGGAPSVLQSVVDDASAATGHLNLTTTCAGYTPYGDPTLVTDPDTHVTMHWGMTY